MAGFGPISKPRDFRSSSNSIQDCPLSAAETTLFSADPEIPGEKQITAIIIRHKAAEFQILKAGFEAYAPARSEAGILDSGIYKEGADKDVTVAVFMEGNDVGAFKAIFPSGEWAAAMKEAGVISAPEVWSGDSLL